jgi:hypothetical protein
MAQFHFTPFDHESKFLVNSYRHPWSNKLRAAHRPFTPLSSCSQTGTNAAALKPWLRPLLRHVSPCQGHLPASPSRPLPQNRISAPSSLFPFPKFALLIHNCIIEAPLVMISVTPTFYKNNFFVQIGKNAYQIVVQMKNFPKINLV